MDRGGLNGEIWDQLHYGWIDRDGHFRPESMPAEWQRDGRGMQIEESRFRAYKFPPSPNDYRRETPLMRQPDMPEILGLKIGPEMRLRNALAMLAVMICAGIIIWAAIGALAQLFYIAAAAIVIRHAWRWMWD